VSNISGGDSVGKGGNLQLTALVNWSDGTTSAEITWSITSAKTGSTGINASGYLTVDGSESNASLTVRAAATADSAQWKEITITVTGDTLPPGSIDFTLGTNAVKLGLSNTDRGVSDLIDDMDGRKNLMFYNPTVPTATDAPSGSKAIDIGQVAAADPGMAWIIDGNNLLIHGETTGTGLKIVFNVAVIDVSTGYGWITGDADNAPYGTTYSRTYATHSERISISELTNGNVTTAAQLGDGTSIGYAVFVIVRMQDGLGAIGDFNQDSDYKNDNVIPVYPYPY
jgi:hypothetical protein